jgi:hypothetical protein
MFFRNVDTYLLKDITLQRTVFLIRHMTHCSQYRSPSSNYRRWKSTENRNPLKDVGFEVLTAVVMKSTVFWDITPCSPLSGNRRFGGTYRLYLQGRKTKLSKKPACLPPAFNLVSCSAYYFDLEDGGDMFLLNVGWHSTDYTALYPRRWYSSPLKDVYLFRFRLCPSLMQLFYQNQGL